MFNRNLFAGLMALAALTCAATPVMPVMPAMADEIVNETPAEVIYMEDEDAAEAETKAAEEAKTAAAEALKKVNSNIVVSSAGELPAEKIIKAEEVKTEATEKTDETAETDKSEEETTEATDAMSESASEEYSPFSLGQRIAQFALQFTGRPYVYGGTSLTNGADCSGFTMSVFQNFGISLPHSSSAQRSLGANVGSLANAQPGDLICYSGHVGLYIGDGQIVHASNSRKGIIVSSATHKRILAIRRVI